MKRAFLTYPLAALALLVGGVFLHGAKPLELEKNDSVAYIGNGTADRMQHHAWLETLIYQTHPEHDLVFRNLGFTGDELKTRLRSQNFGSPDEWLAEVEADVVFVFFGFNESFAGEEGLEAFERDLEDVLNGMAAKRYNGESAPTLVLFSPIAHEDLNDRNLPDGSENNPRLKLYTEAMRKKARELDILFVDLFELSQQLYAETEQPLTFNGIHLTDFGDRALASSVYRAIFEKSAPQYGDETLRLRQAVLDKNGEFFQRYRTVDGYNVYGGRSQLSFDNVTNYDVMQDEMKVRDVLTANRDKRIWAVARGGDLEVTDDNLPPIKQVETNHPGPLPDGSHVFLGGEEAIEKMTVPEGVKVNLFASEEDFPELANPVQMAWDTRNRLWVAVWPSYPERTPQDKYKDKLLIFEDTDQDGKADKVTTFLDGLNCPTGFQFYKDGVLVMQAPNLWFARDTDGDDQADWKEDVLGGIDSADSHHTTNSMVLSPGGATFLSDGVFHRTQVETADGVVRNRDGAIYRYEPRTQKFERYVAYGFANPHGRAFDNWGNDIITDATGNTNYYAPAFSGFLDYPHKHAGMRQFWDRPSRPCPGTGFLYSKHFPEEYWGNFLNINVIGFQGIFRVNVTEQGSGLHGETIPEHLIQSSDPNFRPIYVTTGPDGAIYFADWHNPIIGHMQHHIRDPNRDHEHGRIYRMTYKGRPLAKPAKIHGEPIAKLLDLLKDPQLHVRDQVKIELSARDTEEVMAAVDKWVESLDPEADRYAHHLTEALWVKQYHNVVDKELIKRVLTSPDHRARAAATRVLCYQRDRVPEVMELLRDSANDEHPRVRLEAVRAASFFRTGEAADVALTALKHPTDYYIDYTMRETLRQLEPYWRKAISEGEAISADNPAGIEYLLGEVSTAELLMLPETPAVLSALLFRPGVPEARRSKALEKLAARNNSTLLKELLGALGSLTSEGSDAAKNLSLILRRQTADSLKTARGELLKLFKDGKSAIAREAAAAAIMVADGSVKPLSDEASKDLGDYVTLLRAVPQIPSPAVRATVDDQARAILTRMPDDLAKLVGGDSPENARYVRVELPRRGTLTLAEVQIFSGGRNIGPTGKAKQSSTGYGGSANRAIDGNTDGAYGSGTQTHTNENESNPWWEVDLGRDVPIEAVAIWNRTENGGRFARRLEGFTLTVLDADRQPIFERKGNPAPAESARIPVSADPVGTLQRAAIAALVSTGENPDGTFALLAALIQDKESVTAAAEAMRQLPRDAWSPDAAASTARNLLEWAKDIPATARTSEDFVQTVQIASEMAGHLSDAEASRVRAQLRDLGVSVFVVKTIKEQLRYDTTRLIVEPGKAFEIIFENNDFMPHNLVVVRPDSRTEVGLAAATLPFDKLDDQGRAYVPDSDKILAATKMLEAGQKATLKMTAPREPGVYEYVCTFPGHWMLMWGQLVVTADPEGYLREHPNPPVIQAPGAPTAHGAHHQN